MSYQQIDSEVPDTVSVYPGARVLRSRLGAHCVVGNHSRVDDSVLGAHARIDRNNHLTHAAVGAHSYTGMDTVIMHATLGAFCAVSWHVSIGGADHDVSRIAQHSFLYNHHDGLRPAEADIPYDRFAPPVLIGSDVWLGSGTAVCRGLTIGHGVAVGANSVVTRDVPDFAVVVGAPARVIRMRFTDAVIELLLRLRWWDWDDGLIRQHFAVLSSQPDVGRLRELVAELRA